MKLLAIIVPRCLYYIFQMPKFAKVIILKKNKIAFNLNFPRFLLIILYQLTKFEASSC